MNIEQIIREYLPHIVHMSLATSAQNKPWVCEVHFAYDEDLNLYFRSLPSRRHSQEIALNPLVAGNIIVQHELDTPPKGVYFEGSAELLGTGPEQDKAYECISARFDEDEAILVEAKRADGHQFYKITVNTFYIFGSFEGSPTQKYELPWKGSK